MGLTTTHSRRGRTVQALVVITFITSVVAVDSTPPVAQAATRYTACVTSQIEVTAGATISNVSYEYSTWKGTVHAFSKKAVPVFFFNRGKACHLLMGVPAINAVRNAKSVSAMTNSDMAVSAPVPSTKRVVLDHHQKVEALFLFGSPIPKGVRGCDAATTTGILVQGYARPTPSVGKFFPRKIKNVCFPVGAGATFVNTGVAWFSTPS